MERKMKFKEANIKEIKAAMNKNEYEKIPVVFDTPVPFYDLGVSCGLPNELGEIPPEIIMMPCQLARPSVFMSWAKGDSMEGVNIHSGDMLIMDNVQKYYNHDVVLARIDGEELLKTYYVDEEGRHWLLPSNDKYDAILLTEDTNVQFCGRLIWHIDAPRETTRNIREAITRYLNKHRTPVEASRVPTYEEVVEALNSIAPMVKAGRRWLGACRVLMDCGFIHKGCYDKFCELVDSVLPTHAHLPKAAELQRMATLCFSKPFRKWKDETAPVHGGHFEAYYEIGEAMLEKLP